VSVPWNNKTWAVRMQMDIITRVEAPDMDSAARIARASAYGLTSEAIVEPVEVVDVTEVDPDSPAPAVEGSNWRRALGTC
jgi:hypothetical protein